MKLKYRMLFLVAFAASSVSNSANNNYRVQHAFKTPFKGLKDCLLINYQVADSKVWSFVTDKFLFLDDKSLLPIIEAFIEKSKNISLPKTTSSSKEFLQYDALVKAASWHELIYEDEKIRILWTVTKPGEREPFHMHYWKRILVIIQGALFDLEYTDGNRESATWPAGVYELPPDTVPGSYINRDTCDFMALGFEIKE